MDGEPVSAVDLPHHLPLRHGAALPGAGQGDLQRPAGGGARSLALTGISWRFILACRYSIYKKNYFFPFWKTYVQESEEELENELEEEVEDLLVVEEEEDEALEMGWLDAIQMEENEEVYINKIFM